MPYITQDKRDMLDDAIDELHHKLVEMEMDDELNNMEGNLNYALSRLLIMVYGNADSTNYSNINDAMGVISCVDKEFYRKVAVPYETQKEFDNGSIQVFRNPPEVMETITIDATPIDHDTLTNAIADAEDGSGQSIRKIIKISKDKIIKISKDNFKGFKTDDFNGFKTDD